MPSDTSQTTKIKCSGCEGRGEIGGLLPGDGGYQTDRCPDCDGSGVEPHTAMRSPDYEKQANGDCRYACSAFPNCGCTVEALKAPTQTTIRTCPKCGAKAVAYNCSERGCPVNGGAAYG